MKKLLWMDLEMTGLDVNKEVILEVGSVITNTKLTPLDTYHATVKQPQIYLENMDEWNKTHHKKSGLIDRVLSGKDQRLVEQELIQWASRHFRDEKAILCGNSIQQDRLFINKHFKRFAQILHYRMLDVTSWKIIFNSLFKVQYKKKVAHRAMEDINESIAEMKMYLRYVKT